LRRRRRSNRPGNSQAKGPCYRNIWRAALRAPTEGESIASIGSRAKLSGTWTDGASVPASTPVMSHHFEPCHMKTIAVIGAGITGVTTAYALARRGYEVTVLERHRYAAMETSFANGGQLSASNAECVFHANRTLIPRVSEHPFHGYPNVHSTRKRTLGTWRRGSERFYSDSSLLVKPFRRLRIDSPASVTRCAL